MKRLLFAMALILGSASAAPAQQLIAITNPSSMTPTGWVDLSWGTVSYRFFAEMSFTEAKILWNWDSSFQLTPRASAAVTYWTYTEIPWSCPSSTGQWTITPGTLDWVAYSCTAGDGFWQVNLSSMSSTWIEAEHGNAAPPGAPDPTSPYPTDPYPACPPDSPTPDPNDPIPVPTPGPVGPA